MSGRTTYYFMINILFSCSTSGVTGYPEVSLRPTKRAVQINVPSLRGYLPIVLQTDIGTEYCLSLYPRLLDESRSLTYGDVLYCTVRGSIQKVFFFKISRVRELLLPFLPISWSAH